MTGSGAALTLEDASFRWPGRNGFGLSVPALSMRAGETVLLLGESGSGKSTLLSLVCGILAPQTGRIAVDGADLGQMRAGARDRFRAERIGVIFQQFNLLPYGSVRDNIDLPLRFAPQRRARAGEGEALRLCTALGLPGEVMTRPAGRLSVGQQQRVAVARALIGQPPLIVADEPTSALDARTQDAFLGVLFDQLRAAGAALLMVSHDDRLSARFDRVLRLEDIAQVERAAA
ncbi:MAG: ABC transporter ATP-binding protein [Pseudomonadota bacterium]